MFCSSRDRLCVCVCVSKVQLQRGNFSTLRENTEKKKKEKCAEKNFTNLYGTSYGR